MSWQVGELKSRELSEWRCHPPSCVAAGSYPGTTWRVTHWSSLSNQSCDPRQISGCSSITASWSIAIGKKKYVCRWSTSRFNAKTPPGRLQGKIKGDTLAPCEGSVKVPPDSALVDSRQFLKDCDICGLQWLYLLAGGQA